MKKLTTLLLLSFLFLNCISQQTSPSPSLTKLDYLKKSKHQNIAAISLAGAGFFVWAAGINKYMNQEDNVDGGGEAAMVVGGLSCLASIPLFIIGSKNKKKARLMAINTQRIPQKQKSGFAYQAIPSLSIKIGL